MTDVDQTFFNEVLKQITGQRDTALNAAAESAARVAVISVLLTKANTEIDRLNEVAAAAFAPASTPIVQPVAN